METLARYSQRFVFVGEYIFGKKSPISNILIPDDFHFSDIPFRRIGLCLFDSVCCYIPVHYLDAEISALLADNRDMTLLDQMCAKNAKLRSLKVYLQQNLMMGASDDLVLRKLQEIILAHARISGPEAVHSCAEVKPILNALLSHSPEICWLLEHTWHPYYIAPLHSEMPESALVDNWEDAQWGEAIALRPDMIAGRDVDDFRHQFLFQCTRYLYIKLGFPKDALGDELIYRDKAHLEEKASQLLPILTNIVEAAHVIVPSAEGLLSSTQRLLEVQSSFDDHPVNLHHDADVIAHIHGLRMELERNTGHVPSFSPEMEPVIVRVLEHLLPHTLPAYIRFLKGLQEKIAAT